MAHPKRESAGSLDLHQRLAVLQERNPVHVAFKREVLLTIEDVFIESDAKIRALQVIIGLSFIGEKYRWPQCLIILSEIHDLIANLGVDGKRRPVVKAGHDLHFRKGDPAFIDHRFIFLLQLYKNRILWTHRLIAANAQFFLISGLFQRMPDQPVGVSIQINIANRGAPIIVHPHVWLHSLQNAFFFLLCQQVFHLVAFKSCLICHDRNLLFMRYLTFERR